MRLTWHIVQKDFRRLWLPLALWLVLVLAHTVLLTRAAGLIDSSPVQFDGLGYYAGTWGVIGRTIGFILAAWLVMEDSLVDTRAFWPTRPISGARLLAAKVLGALLMFSILPALGLSPIWLGCGFSLREWGWAALEWGMTQGLLSAAAFVLAGVSTTAGQFLIRTVGLAALLPVIFLFVTGRIVLHPDVIVRPDFTMGVGLEETKYWLVLGLTAVFAAALVVQQFLAPRTARYGVLAGLWLVLLLGVRSAWVWDCTPLILKIAGTGSGREDPAVQSVRFVAGNSALDRKKPAGPWWTISLQGTTTGAPAGTHVVINSISGQWIGAGERYPLTSYMIEDRGMLEKKVRQTAGLPRPADQPDEWTISERIRQPAPRTGLKLEAEVNATLLRGQVWGELPLRKGAELIVGASRTRIAGIDRDNGHVIVRLEEWDAWPWPARMFRHPFHHLPAWSWTGLRPDADGFILVNRSIAYDQFSAATEIGTVRINSIMVGQRALVLTVPTREVNGETMEIPGWEEGAVIVKVRFRRDHPFIRPLAGDGLAVNP